MIMKKLFYLGFLSLLVFCKKTEKTDVLQTENKDEAVAPLALVSDDEVAFPVNDTIEDIQKKPDPTVTKLIKNPDADMDFTLSHLDKTSDANSADFKKWLEGLVIKNYGDDNLPMLSSEVKQIWRDRLDLEYENDRNFTKKDFDKKWKGKIDYKYLGWYQFFYNGQDGPEKVKLGATYIGKVNDAYYYNIKVISLDKGISWPSQTGKIYKVEKLKNKPLITGIFEKGESVVWTK